MFTLTLDKISSELRDIAAAMPGSATRNPKAALEKVAEYLEKSEHRTASALIVALQAAPVKAKTRRQVAPPRIDVISAYLSKLRGSELDLDEFEKTMSVMRADKKVRMAELKQIVADYIGAKIGFSKKDIGFGMIQEKFEERWRMRNRRSAF